MTWNPILKKTVGWLATGGILAGLLILALLIIKGLWAWTIPDLFPGAVRQNMVAESISWTTAGKVALILFLLAFLFRGSRSEKSN